MKRTRMTCVGAVALAGTLGLAALLASAPARAEDDLWAPGRTWLSMRAGYAKVSSETAPPGSVGGGFGSLHMLPRWWIFGHFSLGGYVHFENEGRFGSAALISVPMTLEIARHAMWKTAFRPYVGAGYGAYHIKFYRAPAEPATVSNGGYLLIGGNIPIGPRSAFGVDTRVGEVERTGGVKRWSVKLNYSRVY